MLDLESMKCFLLSEHCRTPYPDMTKLIGIADSTSFARSNNHLIQTLAGEESVKICGADNKAYTPKAAKTNVV